MSMPNKVGNRVEGLRAGAQEIANAAGRIQQRLGHKAEISQRNANILRQPVGGLEIAEFSLVSVGVRIVIHVNVRCATASLCERES